MTSASPGLSHLQPVESSSLNAKVYAHLRNNLMAGRFRPGDTLTLRALAEALGTSVMPVRDAVLRLSGERALEPHGRGVRVPVLDDAQFQDILRIRISLEGDACAMAAERASAAELAAIKRSRLQADRACAAGRLADFVAANQAFHFDVYRAAHNPLLQSLIETLWLQIGPYLALIAEGSTANDCRAIDLTAHAKLVDALERGDAEAARAALKSDLSDREEVLRLIAPAAEAPKKARPRAR